jgi:hypothetical protein
MYATTAACAAVPAFAADAGPHSDRTREAPRPGVAAVVPAHAARSPGRTGARVPPTRAPGRPDQARARVVDDQWSPVKGLDVEATDGFLRVETMLALPRDREAKVP